MTVEYDSYHIERFPFVPVGTCPDIRRLTDVRSLLRYDRFDDNLMFVNHGKEMIHGSEFAVIVVHAANAGAIIKGQIRSFAEKYSRIIQLLGIHFDPWLRCVKLGFKNGFTEFCFQGIVDLLCGHDSFGGMRELRSFRLFS